MIFPMEMKKLAAPSGRAGNLKPLYDHANPGDVIEALEVPSADMSAVAAWSAG